MQISKTQIKWILVYCVGMFLSNQFVESYFRGLSPFNQIFLLTELHSKILLKNTISYTGEINSVAITPDGKTIVSHNIKDNTIKVWNLKTGKLINTIAGNPDKPKIVLISPDLQRVASNEEDGIQILDLKTGKLKTTLSNIGKKRLETFAFSPDGQTLVSNSGDVVYDQEKINPNLISNGKSINIIEVWNLNTGKLKTSFKSDNYCVESLIVISSNGQMVMSCRDLGWSFTPGNINLKIWDVNTGKLKTTFSEKTDFEKPGEKTIEQLTISPDGQTFVTLSGRKTVKIWDMNTGSLKATLPNPKDSEITSIIFSPDKQTLLTSSSGSRDGIKIWNLTTGSLKTTLAGGIMYGNFVISPDGQTLVSSSSGTLLIWDLKTGKYKTALVNSDDKEYVGSVAISPDGQTIVSGNRNLDNKPDSIKIWQMP